MPSANVNTPTQSYSRQADRWRMLEDLCGGTKAMIEAATRWLPKEEAESEPNYRSRLARSVLYPMLADTIETGVARMFSKPVTLQDPDSLPERLQLLEDDADLKGTTLTQFSRQLARDGMKYGRFHFLVEFPATTFSKNRGLEKLSGVRPYFARLSPTDLIGWKFRPFPKYANPDSPETVEVEDLKRHSGLGGRHILSQIRWRETRTVNDGEFGEKDVDVVFVMNDVPEGATWELWEANERGDYAPVDAGELSLGYIPLVTAYYDFEAPFEANPPYEGLAWQNIRHWRSSSEQDNLLRVARVPILTAVGLKAEEIAAGLQIGASKLLASTNPDAKFSFTEHSGAAIGAGRDDLKDIEERGETLGMAPATTRSGAVTATAKAIDESKSGSDLEAWARVTETALYEGYEHAVRLDADQSQKREAKLPDGFSVDIVTESNLSLRTSEDLTALQFAYTSGAITAETFNKELKRRGILSEMVDPEKEAQAARDNPMLGLVTGGGGFNEPDPDPDDADEVAPVAGEAA
jgi:hypothetical protein